MKTTLPKRNLTRTLFLGLMFMLLGTLNGYSQVVFDGSYTPGEYDEGDSIVIDPNASSTCDVNTIYAAVQEDAGEYYLVLGIRNGNNGSAIFRYYFNTISGEGCVGETFKNIYYPVDSADIVIEIDVSKDNAYAVYNWDENSQDWVSDGAEFGTHIGDYTASDGEFSEIRAPLTGSSNITDLCDLGSDGNIHLAQYIAFSGGTTSSNVCSARSIEFSYNVNGNIDGSDAYCEGANTETVLTLSGVYGSVIKWQESYDLQVWVDIANTTNTLTTPSNLYQTTYYRAIINSEICPGIEKPTGVATITITPKPSAIVTNETICEDETYTWTVDGVEYLGTDGDTTVHYEGANCAPDTILNITVNDEPQPIVTNETICEDETYTWTVDGVEYPGTDGDTTVHYEGANCAPDTILNITVNDEPQPIVTNETICEDETYTWTVDGVEYLGTDGDTTVHYEGANCAPDTILNITVNDEPQPIVTNETICEDETYTWTVDGVEYLGTDGDT
ncbi:hypothetical protein D1614_23495, partial [Maribellus luteus]